mmetsp:Transcript_29026/g.66725  ORF Transcript_29026/g.66725 Transcript_29026/m.66725 type:complete len:557 (+) Transcript_29026:80-1750(+)
MSLLNTEQILEDTARQRRLSVSTLAEVWSALNAYITASMEQQRTLVVPSLCKIGWRLNAISKWRPFFHLDESFTRAYGVECNAPHPPPDKVAAGEELNFSKAAIRFSQGLTKDEFYIGLKALVHHIGETFATGQPVTLDLEVGKLISRDSVVAFEFAPTYAVDPGEGDDLSVAMSHERRRVPTFAEPPPEAYMLSVHGSTPGAGSHCAASAVSGDDAMSQAPSSAWSPRMQAAGRTPPQIPRQIPVAQQGSSSVPSEAPAELLQERRVEQPTLQSLTKFDAVHDQALERHVAKLGEAAATAIAEKDMWEQHLQRCVEEEHKDQQWRRAIVKDYCEQLKVQMNQAEERRHKGRLEAIEQASMHDFPNFAEMHAMNGVDAEAYVMQRKANLKQDLDQQVAFKQRLQLHAKQRERDLEMSHNSAVQKEVDFLKSDGVEKKRQDMSNLCQAWEQQCKLRQLRKAIDNHHRAELQPEHITNLVSGGRSVAGPASARGVAGATRGGAAGVQQLNLGEKGLGCTGSEAGPASSRPITGSVRKVPIGAAASLALQKERTSYHRR